jgi:hypothetical protein
VKIPAALQPLLTAPQREIPSLLKQLQVGQVLPAKVLAQLQPNLVRLQVATTELLARTPLQLSTGTHLKLQVLSKQPIPELRILHEPTAGEQRERAVRTAIARQLPPREIRQATSELRNTATTTREQQAVQRFESIIRDAALKPGQLNARQLQRAVAMSGVFHEARMLWGQPAQTGDIKTRLLQLLATLTADSSAAGRKPPSAPPAADGQPAAQTRDSAGDSLLNRLIRLAEGSITRIQLQQSAALPIEESPRQAWQIDLPIQVQDATEDVMLRIERDEAEDGSDDGPGWAVNLAFEFDTIGTLQCRIGLNGDRVATTFWCESAATHARIEQRLPVLQEALEAQGLEVVHLRGVVGEPSDPLIHVPLPDSLLDERA